MYSHVLFNIVDSCILTFCFSEMLKKKKSVTYHILAFRETTQVQQHF